MVKFSYVGVGGLSLVVGPVILMIEVLISRQTVETFHVYNHWTGMLEWNGGLE